MEIALYNLGVFRSSWGEVRRFNRKEVTKVVEENDKEWEGYWDECRYDLPSCSTNSKGE